MNLKDEHNWDQNQVFLALLRGHLFCFARFIEGIEGITTRYSPLAWSGSAFAESPADQFPGGLLARQ